MSSKVQICNLALGHIGQNPISSLDELSTKNPSVLYCNQYYNMALESVLSAHTWRFATRHIILAQIADESINGWEYLYIYPSACLKIIKLFSSGAEKPEEYQEMSSTKTGQKIIVSKIPQALLECVCKVEDTNIFSPTFIEALSFKIASLIANPLCGKIELADNMEKKYQLKIDEAKRVNSSGQRVDEQRSSSYEDVR